MPQAPNPGSPLLPTGRSLWHEFYFSIQVSSPIYPETPCYPVDQIQLLWLTFVEGYPASQLLSIQKQLISPPKTPYLSSSKETA